MKHLIRFVRRTVITILTLTIVFAMPAVALSESEKNFYGKNNIFFYNPDGDCVRTATTGVGNGSNYNFSSLSLTGEDNMVKIWNALVAANIQGISNNPAAIAGIMGNFSKESGFNPFAHTSGTSFYGLYQTNAELLLQQVSRLGNYWGSTAPTDINDAAIKIELDLLTSDVLFSDNRFQSYVNSTITYNIPNSAEGAAIYAELFMLAVERAYGGTDTLQSSEAQAFAANHGLSKYKTWQALGKRRDAAASIFNKFASGSTTSTSSSGTSVINLSTGNTNGLSRNTCRVGNNSPYTGVGIPQYFQCGENWSNLMYGDKGIYGNEGSTICAAGCGPTSFAMMATVLLGRNILPDEVADIAGQAGQHYYGVGSSWTITKVLADHYGLQYKAINTCDISTINQYLRDGWMIHTSGTGRAPFTSSGHYIGITGINSNDEWYIANSAGRNNANGYYSPSAVVSAGMKCANVKAIRR